MKDIYMFPAIFLKEEDGYSVRFPDVDGAFTCGETFEEALLMSKECLELSLDGMEEIPNTSNIEDIKLEENEYIAIIQADMLAFKRKKS